MDHRNFFVELGRIPNEIRLVLIIGWLVVVVLVLGVAVWQARKFEVPSAAGTARSETALGRVIPPISPLSMALGIDPLRPGEPTVGTKIPASELVGRNGVTVRLSEIGNGRPTLLIFLSADCSSCEPVGQSIAAWAKQLAPVQLRIATSSTPQAIIAKYPGIEAITLYGSRSSLLDLGVQRSPAAIALGGSHQPVIASPVAYGLYEIEGLVAALSVSTAR